MQGNFLSPEYAASSGAFRHGQLVKMTVTIRSVKRSSKGCAFRTLQVGLKKLVLVGRNTELVSYMCRLKGMVISADHNESVQLAVVTQVAVGRPEAEGFGEGIDTEEVQKASSGFGETNGDQGGLYS